MQGDAPAEMRGENNWQSFCYIFNYKPCVCLVQMRVAGERQLSQSDLLVFLWNEWPNLTSLGEWCSSNKTLLRIYAQWQVCARTSFCASSMKQAYRAFTWRDWGCLHVESARREAYLGSEGGKRHSAHYPLSAASTDMPGRYRYGALHCCRQSDQRLCQRKWSTANMQLSDPITFSGRARLLHPRRAPPVLHKEFTQASNMLWISGLYAPHVSVCTCGIDSLKLRKWIWSLSWVRLYIIRWCVCVASWPVKLLKKKAFSFWGQLHSLTVLAWMWLDENVPAI